LFCVEFGKSTFGAECLPVYRVQNTVATLSVSDHKYIEQLIPPDDI
jgi:hypothetical protein